MEEQTEDTGGNRTQVSTYAQRTAWPPGAIRAAACHPRHGACRSTLPGADTGNVHWEHPRLQRGPLRPSPGCPGAPDPGGGGRPLLSPHHSLDAGCGCPSPAHSEKLVQKGVRLSKGQPLHPHWSPRHSRSRAWLPGILWPGRVVHCHTHGRSQLHQPLPGCAQGRWVPLGRHWAHGGWSHQRNEVLCRPQGLG